MGGPRNHVVALSDKPVPACAGTRTLRFDLLRVSELVEYKADGR